MKNKTIKLGLIAALGAVATTQPAGAQSPANSPSASSAEGFCTDSVRLEQRLRELSEIPPRTERMMAMCYAMAMVKKKTYADYTCPVCGKTTRNKWTPWQVANLNQIVQITEKLRTAGYDVLLDQSEFCHKCNTSHELWPVPVFKIRYSPQGNYHSVRTGTMDDYRRLLAFLSGELEYKDDYGTPQVLQEEIPQIREMTGLGADLKLP